MTKQKHLRICARACKTPSRRKRSDREELGTKGAPLATPTLHTLQHSSRLQSPASPDLLGVVPTEERPFTRLGTRSPDITDRINQFCGSKINTGHDYGDDGGHALDWVVPRWPLH